MQKNDGNLSRISNSKEIDLLKEEIDLLRGENDALKKQISNLLNKESGVFKAAEDERSSIIFYMEQVGKRISGIPSFANLLREVIKDITIKIKNGEHLKKEKLY